MTGSQAGDVLPPEVLQLIGQRRRVARALLVLRLGIVAFLAVVLIVATVRPMIAVVLGIVGASIATVISAVLTIVALRLNLRERRARRERPSSAGRRSVIP